MDSASSRNFSFEILPKVFSPVVIETDDETKFLSKLISLIDEDPTCFFGYGGPRSKLPDLCHSCPSEFSSECKKEIWSGLIKLCDKCTLEGYSFDHLDCLHFLQLVNALKMDQNWLQEAYGVVLALERIDLESFLKKVKCLSFLISLCINNTGKATPEKAAESLRQIISQLILGDVSPLYHVELLKMMFEFDVGISLSQTEKEQVVEAFKREELSLEDLSKVLVAVVAGSCWTDMECIELIVLFVIKLNAYQQDKQLYTRNLLGLLVSGRVNIHSFVFHQPPIQEFITKTEDFFANHPSEVDEATEELWKVSRHSLQEFQSSQEYVRDGFGFLEKQLNSTFPYVRQAIVHRWLSFLTSEENRLTQLNYRSLISTLQFSPTEYLTQEFYKFDLILTRLNENKANFLYIQYLNGRSNNRGYALISCKMYLEKYLNCFQDPKIRTEVAELLNYNDLIYLNLYRVLWLYPNLDRFNRLNMSLNMLGDITLPELTVMEDLPDEQKNPLMDELSLQFLKRTFKGLEQAKDYHKSEYDLLKPCLPLFSQKEWAQKLSCSLGINLKEYGKRLDLIVLKKILGLIQQASKNAKISPEMHSNYKNAALLIDRIPACEEKKVLVSMLVPKDYLLVMIESSRLSFDLTEKTREQMLFFETFIKLSPEDKKTALANVIERTSDSTFIIEALKRMRFDEPYVLYDTFSFFWNLAKKYKCLDNARQIVSISLSKTWKFENPRQLRNKQNLHDFFRMLSEIWIFFNKTKENGFNYAGFIFKMKKIICIDIQKQIEGVIAAEEIDEKEECTKEDIKQIYVLTDLKGILKNYMEAKLEFFKTHHIKI